MRIIQQIVKVVSIGALPGVEIAVLFPNILVPFRSNRDIERPVTE